MARSAAQAQDAYLERSQRNDKIATGVLTLIVGLVMVIVVSMVLFILRNAFQAWFSYRGLACQWYSRRCGVSAI